MKHPIAITLLALTLAPAGFGADPAPRRLSRQALRDKIKGAWAGQMIGIAYGAKTEFRAKGVRFETEMARSRMSSTILSESPTVNPR